jgi:NtrC-family two-component system response regulator AlgB
VRELRNMIERTAIVCPEENVDSSHLGLGDGKPDGAGSTRVGAKVSLAELERAHVQAVLGTANTLEEAARILGIDVSTLYRKRKQFNV